MVICDTSGHGQAPKRENAADKKKRRIEGMFRQKKADAKASEEMQKKGTK